MLITIDSNNNIQILAAVSGSLTNWMEFPCLKLVTVGSKEVFFIMKLNVTSDKVEDFLQIAKIGTRTSSAQKKDSLVGLSYVESDSTQMLITISENGSIYRMKYEQNEPFTTTLVTVKTFKFICRHCFSLFRDSTSLKSHVSKLHRGPVMCVMCQGNFDDIAELNTHKTNCFYSCGVPAYNLKHSRLAIALNHKKEYLRSLE